MAEENLKKQRILEIIKEFNQLSTHGIVKHYTEKFGVKSKGSLGISEKRGLNWYEVKMYLTMLESEGKITKEEEGKKWRVK
jgi:hypothetical protein